MQFTELTIRILFLFFPGILCHLIVDMFAVHRERKVFEVVIYSFVYGVTSYLMYTLFVFLMSFGPLDGGLGFHYPKLHFADFLTSTEAKIDFSEISGATFFGIFLGLLVSATINSSLHFRLVSKLKITRKFSDPNVWSFVFNLKDVEWAVVRDLSQNRMYFGYVRAFRDVDELAEILLTDVIVYDEITGEEMYQCAKIYISRPHDNITIDLPSFSSGDENSELKQVEEHTDESSSKREKSSRRVRKKRRSK